MASIKFYINKPAAKWTEEESLYATFTHCYARGNYQRLRIAPLEPIKLNPKTWDSKKQKVTAKTSAALKIQQAINDEIKRIADAWEDLCVVARPTGIAPSMEELRLKLKGEPGAISTQSYTTIYDLIELYLSEKRLSYAKKTVEFYEKSLTGILKRFEKDSLQSMKIEHVDLTFFNRFKTFCAGEGTFNQSTNSYLEKLVAVLRWNQEHSAESIRNRISLDYMRVKKLPTSKKGERDHISEDEAVFLFNLDLMESSWSTIRDIYLFTVFTGPRFNDALNLHVDTNIREIETANGSKMRVLYFVQQKTKGVEEIIVPLNHICEAIIKRNNPGKAGKIFRPMRNGSFNDALKEIFSRLKDFHQYIERNEQQFLEVGYSVAPKQARWAAKALDLTTPGPDLAPRLQKAMKVISGFLKIREDVNYVGPHRVAETYQRWEKLTAHTGRHSFGSLLADKGASVKEAQKMLGHRNSRTTEKYFHIDQEKTVQKVADMLAVPVLKVG